MNLDTLYAILSWVLPPLLGAIIGYVTNDIAIRMLFRPLVEKRVFGLRLPFTPGIIPKQRHELAESIGLMVSRELITEEVLRAQISRSEFRSRLKQSAAVLLKDLARSRFARLQEGSFAALQEPLEGFLAGTLNRFFNSRGFIHASRSLVERLVHALGGLSLPALLGRSDLAGLLAGRVLPLLTGPQARRRTARAVTRWLRAQRESGAKLADFIPEELPGLLAAPLLSFLPSLLEALFRWLREEEMRQQLEERGKRLLRVVLDRLNLLQKIIVSAGAFDRTLEQKMPEILDDALERLEEAAGDEENRRKLVEAVVRALSRWRGKGVAEALGADETALEDGVEKVLGFLDQEPVRERIGRALERLVQGRPDRPIGEILARTFGIGEGEIVEFASTQLLRALSKPETAPAIARELMGFVRHFLENGDAAASDDPGASGDAPGDGQDPPGTAGPTVGELFTLDAARLDVLAEFVTERVVRILDRHLPDLIQSFDFRGLVVRKINELNVAEVEQLLMMVIAKHLKWINLFGAILGAIIGFAQLGIRLLR